MPRYKAELTIWPAPSTSSFGTGVRTVVPSKAFFRLSTGSSPLLEAAFERYPWFESEELDQKASWWGYYEVTPDYSPVLGRVPAAPSFVNACGFSGHGVMHAPAAGLVIAEEVLDGEAHSVDLSPFRLDRFDGADLTIETAVI